MVKPLAKSVLIPLGLTAATAADTGIHKKILGSDYHPLSSTLHNHSPSSASHNNTLLIISNDEVKDIIRIVKSLEGSGLLLKVVSETIQNEGKEWKGGFLSILIGTLGASLLGNILAGKGINRAGEEIIRAGYGNKRQGHKNKMEF